MHKVNLKFFEDLVRFDVADEDGVVSMFRATIEVNYLIPLLESGRFCTMQAEVPALPVPLVIQITHSSVIIESPGQPVVFDREALLSSLREGAQHGTEK